MSRPQIIDANDMVAYIDAKYINYASATTADRT